MEDMNDVKRVKEIVASIISRMLAAALDSILIAVVGLLLAIFLKPILYKLGENGVWIGVVVIFGYMGITQSEAGGGQSLGQRLLGIQIVRMDGGYMSIPQACLRFSVLAFVFFPQTVSLSLRSIMPWLFDSMITPLYIIAMVVAFFGCTLLLAFHPQRRGLQDYIANTVVVKKGRYNSAKLSELSNARLIKRAWIVTLVVCGISVLSTTFLWQEYGDRLWYFRSTRVLEMQDFENVCVIISNDKQPPHKKATKMLTVYGYAGPTIMMSSDILNLKMWDMLNKVRLVYQDRMDEIGRVVIRLRTGYNIGIASSYRHFQKTFDMRDASVVQPWGL